MALNLHAQFINFLKIKDHLKYLNKFLTFNLYYYSITFFEFKYNDINSLFHHFIALLIQKLIR